MSLRIASMMLLFSICTAFSHAQVDISSRFLPDKEYLLTVTQTVTGHDGEKDVAPGGTSQLYTIRTGAASGGAMPVSMTVHTPRQLTQGDDAVRVEWEFTFTIHDDDSFGTIALRSAGESGDATLVTSVLHRNLSTLLFAPPYKLESGRNTGTPIVERAVPRDGAGELYDVTYVLEMPQLKETGSPMTQHAGGHGLFDAQLGFFTEFVRLERSTIYVYEDALGDGKQIVIERETRITAEIRDTQP
jgi:hypothetical protein